MLVIRFQRVGKKHQPSYRLVVAERRSKMAAPPVEDLGAYNPFTKKVSVLRERVLHWIKVGAKPSATVWNILAREGVVTGGKIKIKVRAKKTGSAPAVEAAAPAETATS